MCRELRLGKLLSWPPPQPPSRYRPLNGDTAVRSGGESEAELSTGIRLEPDMQMDMLMLDGGSQQAGGKETAWCRTYDPSLVPEGLSHVYTAGPGATGELEAMQGHIAFRLHGTYAFAFGAGMEQETPGMEGLRRSLDGRLFAHEHLIPGQRDEIPWTLGNESSELR